MSPTLGKAVKLFPRNLTARADTLVRGNPVTSRPEDAVEVSFPGLEFDHRNLDKVFFPGITFEFHHERGAFVRDFDRKGPVAGFFNKSEIHSGIFLAFVQGLVKRSHADPAPQKTSFNFTPPAGLENWRVVRDFEPGDVAVVLCNRRSFRDLLTNRLSDDGFDVDLRTRRDRVVTSGASEFVLLFGERARFLTKEGVIDPRLVPAGDLTRSMCSPWQYDFADCGCFYWASNKPDLVSSAHQSEQLLNFQRRDRSAKSDEAARPEDWMVKFAPDWDGPAIYSHTQLISQWTKLDVVIDGKEVRSHTPRHVPRPPVLLSRAEVIHRLRQLAPVEHALAVEYLYAYYSLDLPQGPAGQPHASPWQQPERPPGAASPVQLLYSAGNEVLSVAIDEMRHFRWVNEMLQHLEADPVFGRATRVGLHRGSPLFDLEPLTDDRLAWFIKVEHASTKIGTPSGTLDGMYTQILYSVENNRAEFNAADRDRIAHAVKIIIDEGADHEQRFLRAHEALSGFLKQKSTPHLRVKQGPAPQKPGGDAALLQKTVDGAYSVVLDSLQIVFDSEPVLRPAMLEAARRSMYIMDAACRRLSEQYKAGALFTLPASVKRTKRAAPRRGAAKARISAVTAVRGLGGALQGHLVKMRGTRHKELGARLEGELSRLKQEFETAAAGVRDDAPPPQPHPR